MRCINCILGIAIIVISVFYIVYCIIRGRGTWHKKLVCFASLLGMMILICFGGNAILSLFGMGWRCTPFNAMLFLGAIFFIITLWYSMQELIVLKNANPTIVRCGIISMLLVIIITLAAVFLYFTLSSWCWYDDLTTYNEQTIVYATNGHGSFGSWRYYTHINDLVHGEQVLQDGWRGVPPRSFS